MHIRIYIRLEVFLPTKADMMELGLWLVVLVGPTFRASALIPKGPGGVMPVDVAVGGITWSVTGGGVSSECSSPWPPVTSPPASGACSWPVSVLSAPRSSPYGSCAVQGEVDVNAEDFFSGGVAASSAEEKQPRDAKAISARKP